MNKTTTKQIPLAILMIYFSSKLLWDKISFDLSEYVSYFYIGIGLYYFSLNMRKVDVKILSIFMLFSIYVCFNGFLLTDTAHLARGIYEYIFYGLIFFSSVGYLKKSNKASIEKFLEVFALFGLVLSLVTIVEYFRGTNFIKSSVSDALGTNISGYGYVFRPKAFTRSFLSHGLLMGLFVLANIYQYKKTNERKWIVIAAFCVVAVVITSSRGPLVATFISSIYLLVDKQKLKRMNSRDLVKWFVVLFLVVFFFYFLFYSDIHFQNPNIEYFLTRIRSIVNWESDAGNNGRVLRWTNYIEYYNAHNRLIGSGVARTGSSGVASIMGTTESEILKILVEMGIVGIILRYSFIFKIIKSSLYIRKCAFKIDDELFKLSASSILCIMIDEITLQVTEEIMIAFFLFFYLALLFSCCELSDSQNKLYGDTV